jgi:mannitol-specific phosphotransferase system IIBC component
VVCEVATVRLIIKMGLSAVKATGSIIDSMAKVSRTIPQEKSCIKVLSKKVSLMVMVFGILHKDKSNTKASVRKVDQLGVQASFTTANKTILSRARAVNYHGFSFGRSQRGSHSSC